MFTDEYDAGVGGLAGISRHRFNNSANIQSNETKNYALQLLNGSALNFDSVTMDVCNSIRNKTIYGGNAVGGTIGISLGYGVANNCTVSAVVYGDDIVGGFEGAGSNLSNTQGQEISGNTIDNSLVIGRNIVGGCLGINTFNKSTATVKNSKVFGQYAVGGMVGMITQNNWSVQGTVSDTNVSSKAFAGGFCGLINNEPKVPEATISNVKVFSKYFSGGFAGAAYSSSEIKFLNVTSLTIKDSSFESTMFAGGFAGFYNTKQNSSISGRKNIDNNLTALIERFEQGSRTGSDLYAYVLGVLSGNDDVLKNISAVYVTFDNSSIKLESTCNANAKIGASGIFGHLPNGLKGVIDCSKIDCQTLVTTADSIGSIENEDGVFSYSGGVCGRIPKDTVILKATFKGEIMSSTDNYGEICEINYGTLEECSFTDKVTSSAKHVGGLCSVNKGTIKICKFGANIETGSNSETGSMCAINKGTVTDCNANSGSITANSATYSGAIVGRNLGTITNCENHATVSGAKNSAGIAGSSANATFENCSNFAEITGVDTAGGIMGAFESGANTFTFKECVNTGKTSATANAGIAASVSGTAVFELCRNYGESAYAMTATDVSRITSYTIHNCLEAGGGGSDKIANGADVANLTRDFYFRGTTSKPAYSDDTTIYNATTDNSVWPINLKLINNSVVYERGDVYCETGIDSVTVNPETAGFDRQQLYNEMDSKFVTMAKDETGHPNADTDANLNGFVKNTTTP